jgi:hypothetical protein
MTRIMLSTEDETWTLEDEGDGDLLLIYRNDDDGTECYLPCNDAVLRTLAARRARHEALH